MGVASRSIMETTVCGWCVDGVWMKWSWTDHTDTAHRPLNDLLLGGREERRWDVGRSAGMGSVLGVCVGDCDSMYELYVRA